MKENEGKCHLLLGAADERNNQVFKNDPQEYVDSKFKRLILYKF